MSRETITANVSRAALTSGHVDNTLPEELQPLYDGYVALRDVMYVFFGFNLDASYHDKVTNFAACYEKLNLPISTTTTKVQWLVHVFISYLPELDILCEQVVGQCHSKFNRLFIQFKIKDCNHMKYELFE